MQAISTRTRFLGRILREPLLQFLLLGGLLFAGAHWLSGWRDAQQRRIVIDASQVDYQRNLYRTQFGAWPDELTLEALIGNRIRDEALYREARRLGLDDDDAIIRQRLIQKMEFVLTDAVQPPEPDDAVLREFLAAHPQRYQSPGRASFELRFFSGDADGSAAAEARATAALRRLAAGDQVAGDPFALGQDFSQLDADALRRHFGDSPMASVPLQAPLHQWSGPFRSGYGWHLIRVSDRQAAAVPDFAALRPALRADWLDDFRERDLRARIDALVARHEIVRLDRPDTP